MARKDDFRNRPTFCVMCGNPLPPDKPKMGLTCSDKCRDDRKDFRRSKVDARECRYCHKPSTPEERVLYQRWRRATLKEEAAQAAKQPEEPHGVENTMPIPKEQK